MGALLEPFFYIIALVVDIYFKVVVVEVVLHWLIHFKILEADNKYAKKTMEILEKATEPVYTCNPCWPARRRRTRRHRAA